MTLSLPEASPDLFVSTRMEDWELSVSGNRFALQTPVIRPAFSFLQAEAIETVLVGFKPAGGVLSQTSQICNDSGVWTLRIEGTLSRGTTEKIAIRSVEIIYRDDSAELVPLGEKLSLDAMSARDGGDGTGGCNGWSGALALVLVGLFMLKRTS